MNENNCASDFFQKSLARGSLRPRICGTQPTEGRQSPSVLRKRIFSRSSSLRDGKQSSMYHRGHTTTFAHAPAGSDAPMPDVALAKSVAVFFPISKIEYQLNLHFLATGRFCRPSLRCCADASTSIRCGTTRSGRRRIISIRYTCST